MTILPKPIATYDYPHQYQSFVGLQFSKDDKTLFFATEYGDYGSWMIGSNSVSGSILGRQCTGADWPSDDKILVRQSYWSMDFDFRPTDPFSMVRWLEHLGAPLKRRYLGATGDDGRVISFNTYRQSNASDYSAQVYDVANSRMIVDGLKDESISFESNGKSCLAYNYHSRQVRSIDLPTGKEIARYTMKMPYVSYMLPVAGGKQAWFLDSSRFRLEKIDFAKGKLVEEKLGLYIERVSRDEKWVYGRVDSGIALEYLPAGKFAPIDQADRAAFSHDGKLLAVAGYKGFRVFKLADLKKAALGKNGK